MVMFVHIWGDIAEGYIKIYNVENNGEFICILRVSPSEQLQEPIKLVNAGIVVLTLFRFLFSHGNNRICCMYTQCMIPS